MVEHLTFNQGVRSSSLRWITKKLVFTDELFIFLYSDNLFIPFNLFFIPIIKKLLTFSKKIFKIISIKRHKEENYAQ